MLEAARLTESGVPEAVATDQPSGALKPDRTAPAEDRRPGRPRWPSPQRTKRRGRLALFERGSGLAGGPSLGGVFDRGRGRITRGGRELNHSSVGVCRSVAHSLRESVRIRDLRPPLGPPLATRAGMILTRGPDYRAGS